MATAKKRKTKKTTAAKKKSSAKKTAGKKTSSTRKTASKKTSSTRKTAGKKTSSTRKKTASKKSAAKKSAPKKSATKKSATKKSSPKKSAPKKSSARKTGKKTSARKKAPGVADIAQADASLFLPFSEGERADALRILTEDPRLARMASVGRYRVIATEPLAVKPPHSLSGCRAARIVIYDYAADRSVDGCVDLDSRKVAFLSISRAQPMLAREEEAAAIAIALGDDRVKSQLSLGDEPQVAMHYWSRSDTSISFSRRSAAVLFGRSDSGPSLVAVVDLLDNLVCEIVPADQW